MKPNYPMVGPVFLIFLAIADPSRRPGRLAEARIDLMSRVSSEDLVRRGLVLSHGHLLTKPVAPDELLGLVQRRLPAGRAPAAGGRRDHCPMSYRVEL